MTFECWSADYVFIIGSVSLGSLPQFADNLCIGTEDSGKCYQWQHPDEQPDEEEPLGDE